MSNKLFVGNLDFSTAEQDLRDAFAPFGNIASVALITDRDTGRPRGFGFVEYESAQDAQKAVSTLDGIDLRGRTIHVSVARERAPRDGQSRRDGDSGGRGEFRRSSRG